MGKEISSAFIIGLIYLGFFIGVITMALITSNDISLNQETGNDICYNITAMDGVVASEENGKLVCEVPSFDSTSNIIVKNNGEE